MKVLHESFSSLGGTSPLNNEDLQSFDSDDLIEISKYYEKRDKYQNLKSEIECSRKKLRKLPRNPKMLKVLFRKTLDKLKKYKNEQMTMQEKILDLQVTLYGFHCSSFRMH